ncbi:nuclear transport factor 2 family protein [Croceicoccus sp. F390]|uniref:Nuclear transport factor 2 family protein n=1 Tax=Croceicoccus esteveae TaxID=3075597 RepID=A0ABU2ZEE9_9SPHN|nr:nuclear transport factor 2 family protein [Croceicoccus sp. F390]MDT0574972.1 nuclear transport factor 2 family protein [Croceicoccus sp. F390]
MMLSLQQLSDRAEIQDLMTSYSYAIDDRNWDALDDVFTPDAIIDYSEAGGSRGDVATTKRFLAGAMKSFTGFQHMVSTTDIKINGDEAHARTILFNPMIMEGEASGENRGRIFFIGLWYEDTVVRSPKGWRISHRRERMSWSHNVPDGMLPE